MARTTIRGKRLACLLMCTGFVSLLMGDVRIVQGADDFEQEPVSYRTAPVNNPVSRLQASLESGETVLEYDEDFGYLRAVLRALQVPESSQMLVFSKTSLQRHRIHPRTPRALYFNDEMYVGFCQNGDVLEFSAVDPGLGTVFYTLKQSADEPPVFKRQTDNCLICHASSHTSGVPGHLVRSVFPDLGGVPHYASGTHRIDQTSPLKHRWGGWYVTGTHGKQSHLGNLILRTQTEPEEVDNSAGHNVTDLSTRFKTKAYLTGHSDIVALMVLEHQTEAHNLLTRANFQTRMALHYEKTLNRELGEAPDHRWPSTLSRIRSVGEPVVKYLLFSGETKLTDEIRGTTTFAEEFSRQGLRDSQGRSLRDFDLQTRMFRYPCSYLVYSPTFAALPAEAKEYIYRRFWEVLTGEDQSEEFAHLTAADRKAILEILLETQKDLPTSWRSDEKPAAE